MTGHCRSERWPTCEISAGLRPSIFASIMQVRKNYERHLLIASANHVKYSGADKSLARPTSRCILFNGENISFDATHVIYIYIYIYIYIVLIFLQL